MAKLMWICGILLAAAGIALGVVLLVTPSVPGSLTIDTAAVLLVGGVLALGLGGVIDALRHNRLQVAVEAPAPAPAARTAEAPSEAPAAIPEFGPRGAKAAAAAAAAAAATATTAVETAAAEPVEEVSRPTRETIQALEQARQKIEQAFDSRKSAPQPKAEPEAPAAEDEIGPDEVVAEEVVAEDMVLEEDVIDDGQLYVVEERVIRNHPARILSDGTVEAETAEGWMRFENLEHLDEYLDAIETA